MFAPVCSVLLCFYHLDNILIMYMSVCFCVLVSPLRRALNMLYFVLQLLTKDLVYFQLEETENIILHI